MWFLWALLAAISSSLVIILTKAGLKNIDSNLAFAIQSVLILSISWTVVAISGNISELKNLEQKTWILLISAGIATTLSTLFSFKALSIGQAANVTTIERSSLVFALIMSVIFLKEKFTWQLLLGAGLILAGAVIIGLSTTDK